MSRHDRGMSGANNVPLGARAPKATFGKPPAERLSTTGDVGSLLKPSYLQGSDGGLPMHSPPSSKGHSRFGNISSFGGQPPGTELGEYGTHVQPVMGNSYNQGAFATGPSAPSVLPSNPYQQIPQQPQGIKRPNPALIASINAALGHKAGTAPPPLVAGSTAAGVQSAAGASSPTNESLGASERKRKRKSRWGAAEGEKTCIPGMPTVIPSGLSKEQEEAYLLQLKIEDASRRLRTGDFGIPANPEDRSPSPEPIYSSDGKRMNTREYRKRKELEEHRHNDIIRIMEINEDFKPPADYKPPQIKVNDKVMIPQDEHPEINFVGLLIGPRGNTLKSMEKDTGAKIIIRGKGSVKEGKVGRKDGQPLPGEDEPLHAYVTATNVEAVRKAVIKINEVIKQGVEIPEGQNDLRKNQLRELALLNGTLREGDQPRCSNCGAEDHKSWQCQDRQNVTNNVVCTTCGGVGHPAKDCVAKRPGTNFGTTGPGSNQNMDEEYMSLMAELGEGSVTTIKTENGSQSGGKPWQQGGGASGRSGSAMFNNRPSAPRALLGPGDEKSGTAAGRSTNRSQGNNGWSGFGPPGSSSQKPPSLMQQQIPPPWGSQNRSGSNSRQGGSWNEPPPPGGASDGSSRGAPGMPQPPGRWGSSSGGFGVPPPTANWSGSSGGPPPPPPGVGNNRSSSSSASATSPTSSGGSGSSWNMPPWNSGPPPPGVPPPPGPPPVGAPGPVPPPMPRSGPSGANNSGPQGPPPNWGGWWGPPPPPGMGSSGNQQGSGNSSKLLELVGSAPPPPPPT